MDWELEKIISERKRTTKRNNAELGKKKKKFTTNLKIQIFVIHIDVICSIIYKGGNLNKLK